MILKIMNYVDMETEKLNKKKRSITKAVIISLAIIGALVGLVFLILEEQRREKGRKMEELVEIGVRTLIMQIP